MAIQILFSIYLFVIFLLSISSKTHALFLVPVFIAIVSKLVRFTLSQSSQDKAVSLTAKAIDLPVSEKSFATAS